MPRNDKTRAEVQPATVAIHSLAPCTIHYLQALEAPFKLREPVCIPDLHSVPSKKTRVLTRGVFETSTTTGCGYIMVNPWRADSSFSLAWKTTPDYTGTSSTLYNAAAIGVNGIISTKFPYASGAWSPGVNGGVKHRIVGVGLRVRYTGLELYKGGRAVMLRSPDNTDLQLVENIDRTFEYDQAKSFPVTSEWVMVAYKDRKSVV